MQRTYTADLKEGSFYWIKRRAEEEWEPGLWAYGGWHFCGADLNIFEQGKLVIGEEIKRPEEGR